MRTLKNILDLENFTSLVREGKIDPYSSCPWWEDCINTVITSVCQDLTTTKQNLHDKARDYALNILATTTEVSYVPKDKMAEDIANEVEKELKDRDFDNRPLASIQAQKDRNSVVERPEQKYIKLG